MLDICNYMSAIWNLENNVYDVFWNESENDLFPFKFDSLNVLTEFYTPVSQTRWIPRPNGNIGKKIFPDGKKFLKFQPHWEIAL